jgi:Flp pilus assembly protein TadD
MKSSISEKKTLPILLFLVVVTLLAYWQVSHNEFISFDDDLYITNNGLILNGVTIEGIRWAFTTYHAYNWHPLTWISHMLDVQLFGLNPRWHHLTNLFLHIANTLLLFFVFHRMTKALWKSALVAALFALHPIHVESVAWAAERKDVLSTFFWMLTMGAYVYYVERPGYKRYLFVLAFFLLGLMSKPMLVTLPFVLLLLDFWPLKRFEQRMSAPKVRAAVSKMASADKRKEKSKKKSALKSAAETQNPQAGTGQWTWIRPLLWEKIPLFVLTALSCILTYLAQEKGGLVVPIKVLPLGARISNAFISYIHYIAKMIWPVDLAFFYPLPWMQPLWQVIGAAMLFLAASFMAIRWAKRFPYLMVGWLWYVGTLVPVIGIVQVATQAMADRYTYVPLIGLFIIIAWGIPELLRRWRWRKEALVAASASILLCLTTVTYVQVGYWQNSLTLFDHTLRVTNENSLIYNNRGALYVSLGNYIQAIADLDRAIEINPKYAQAYSNRGAAYDSLGNFTRAIQDYDRAIEIAPQYAKAYSNRGNAYINIGNYIQAIADLDRAIKINPKYANAYNNRGFAFGKLGNFTRAIQDYDRAIEINPKYAEAYVNRGGAYCLLGKNEHGIDDLKTAVKLGSEDAKNLLRSLKLSR